MMQLLRYGSALLSIIGVLISVLASVTPSEEVLKSYLAINEDPVEVDPEQHWELHKLIEGARLAAPFLVEESDRQVIRRLLSPSVIGPPALHAFASKRSQSGHFEVEELNEAYLKLYENEKNNEQRVSDANLVIAYIRVALYLATVISIVIAAALSLGNLLLRDRNA